MPASGSVSASQRISAEAAEIVVASSDWRSLSSILVISSRKSAFSSELEGSSFGLAVTFGASDFLASFLLACSAPCWIASLTFFRDSLACSGVITRYSTQRLAISCKVSSSLDISGIGCCATGRNRSWEVWPTACAWEASSPGTVITRVDPLITTSEPETPIPLTRCSRMSRACLS